MKTENTPTIHAVDIVTGEDLTINTALLRGPDAARLRSLIAAAPDLLAALKMALGSLLYLKEQSAHLGEDSAEHAADLMAFRAAYEAINKAEGRA